MTNLTGNSRYSIRKQFLILIFDPHTSMTLTCRWGNRDPEIVNIRVWMTSSNLNLPV